MTAVAFTVGGAPLAALPFAALGVALLVFSLRWTWRLRRAR